MIDWMNNVGQGWISSINPTPEQKANAEARKKICATCDNRKELMEIVYCGLCYCPLSKKAYAPNDKCPDNKW